MGASLEELISVLGKSGIPLPSSAGGTADAQTMQNAAPGAGQNIANTVQGQDTVIPGLKSSFHGQLDQIAMMDSKLHDLYNDPSSPLHLNDPGKALKLQSGASDQGYKASSFIAGAEKDRQSELDKQVSDAVSLYSKLTTMQDREEARAKQSLKDDIAVAGGKKQYVTDSTGKKVAVSTPKSPSQKVTDSQNRADTARQQKMQLAGLSDSSAVATFDNIKEPGFRTWYFQSMQDARNSGQGNIPENGFTKQDVLDTYKYWKTNVNPPKKGALSRGGTGTVSGSAADLVK